MIGTFEAMEPGRRTELVVLRNNQRATLTATLGSRDNFLFHGQSDDQFTQGRGNGRFDEDDEFSNVPPYAMQMEHDRRMAEQHQRIEDELRKLQEEVRKLRDALQQLN